MAYKLRFLPGFQAELDAVVDALQMNSPSAALALADELDKAIDLVTAYPFAMQVYPLETKHPDVYRAIDVKNYLAFYVVMDDVVEFRRFLYARSNIPAFFQSGNPPRLP